MTLAGIELSREALKKQLFHDAHPFVQFVKYGVAGVIATCVHASLFFLLGWKVWPCLEATDPMVKLFHLDVQVVAEASRAWYSMLCNVISFLVSNAFAYVLNILFVFRGGRHHWLMEIGMFYAVSSFSVAIGTVLIGVLIKTFGMATSIAFVVNVCVSLAINFVVRKFFIFKR